jgi:predicted transcriptional regulator
MKLFAEILFFLLFSPILFAQNTVGLSDVLDASLDSYYSQFQKNEYQDFSPAWFDDIEIRSETHDFELRKQEYNIRFSPVSIWVRSAQKDYYRSKMMEYDLETRKMVADNIRIIYDNWLSLVIDKRIISITDSLMFIYEDEETVRKRTLNFDIENVDRFIDFREKKNDMLVDHLSYQNEYKILKKQIFTKNNIDTNFEINDMLIDLELIRKAMNNLKNHNIYENTAIYKELQIEESMVSNELKIEEAENSKILDFLQFSYRGPHDDPMNERLLMTLAIRLPLAGRNKMDTELLKVESLEIQNNMKAQEQEFLFEINEILTKLEVLFSEYDVMKNYSDELQEESIFLEKSLGNLANSPLWLISNKKNILKTKLKLLEISEEIYTEYIDLLDVMGVFALDPAKNYLEKLPEF